MYKAEVVYYQQLIGDTGIVIFRVQQAQTGWWKEACIILLWHIKCNISHFILDF